MNPAKKKRETSVKAPLQVQLADVLLDSEVKKVQATLNRNISKVWTCITASMGTERLIGSLNYVIQIGPMGNVTSVVLKDDTTGSKAVDACVQKEIRQWRFMQTREGVEFMIKLVDGKP